MSKNKGQLVAGAVRPNDSLDDIASAFSNEIKGGIHSYETVAERNAVYTSRRQWGMKVLVYNDTDTNLNGLYTLTEDFIDSDITNNSNFQKEITLYVGTAHDSIIDIIGYVPAESTDLNNYILKAGDDVLGNLNFSPSVGPIWSDSSAITSAGGMLYLTAGSFTNLDAGYFNLSRRSNLSASNWVAGSENIGLYYSTGDQRWNTGNIAVQREVVFDRVTYRAVGSSTIDIAATVAIVGTPINTTNMHITNPLSLWIQSGNVRISDLTASSIVVTDANKNLVSSSIATVLGYTPANDSLVVHLAGTESITGQKTFQSSIYANSGLDLTATGGSDILYIGNTNADVITVGRTGAVSNILSSTLNIADKLITLNYTGATASGASVGFEVEENSIVTGYWKTGTSRNSWITKTPAVAYTAEFLYSSLSGNTIYTLPATTGVLALISDIPTGITVDSTTIISGTNGRIGFEKLGKYSQSANLFWDDSLSLLQLNSTNYNVLDITSSHATTTSATVTHGGSIGQFLAQSGAFNVSGFSSNGQGVFASTNFNVYANGAAVVELKSQVSSYTLQQWTAPNGTGIGQMYQSNDGTFHMYTTGSVRIDDNINFGIGVDATARVHAQSSGTTSGSFIAKFNNVSENVFHIRSDKRIIYTDGNQATDYILGCDSNGVATWRAPVAGYSDSSARLAISGTAPVSYNSSTGAISMAVATTSVNGYLSSTDWTTFNSKQTALTLGNLTEATSSILTITGGAGAIVGSGLTILVKTAATAQSGYLTSTDWNTFNGKQAALTFGSGLSGTTTITANLITGLAGGQTIIGGTAANESLTLTGTSHATKTTSYIVLGTTEGVKIPSLTSGRLPFITTGGLWADSANVTASANGITLNGLSCKLFVRNTNDGEPVSTFDSTVNSMFSRSITSTQPANVVISNSLATTGSRKLLLNLANNATATAGNGVAISFDYNSLSRGFIEHVLVDATSSAQHTRFNFLNMSAGALVAPLQLYRNTVAIGHSADYVTTGVLDIKGAGSGSGLGIIHYQSDATTVAFSVTDAGAGLFKAGLTAAGLFINNTTGNIFVRNGTDGNVSAQFDSQVHSKASRAITGSVPGIVSITNGLSTTGTIKCILSLENKANATAGNGLAMMFNYGATPLSRGFIEHVLTDATASHEHSRFNFLVMSDGALVAPLQVYRNFVAIGQAIDYVPTVALDVLGTANFTTGDVKISTAGKGLYVKEGSNATMGTGTLVAGTATISTTKVTASSRIFITDAGGGVLANIGALYISAQTAGTSFAITSMNVLDTSNFNWIIIEPA